MGQGQKSTIVASRAILSILWGTLCGAIVAAPILAASGRPGAAAAIYALFAPVCHQDPGRCFWLCGLPFAACHRCSGIYAGLLAGTWLPYGLGGILDVPARRRLWVIGAALPLLLDAGLQFAGLWTSTITTRAATGLLFGAMLSTLLVPGLNEILTTLMRKRFGLASEA